MSLKTDTSLVSQHVLNAYLPILSPLWICENMDDFSQTEGLQLARLKEHTGSYLADSYLIFFLQYVFLKQQSFFFIPSFTIFPLRWMAGQASERPWEHRKKKKTYLNWGKMLKPFLHCLTLSVTLCKRYSAALSRHREGITHLRELKHAEL